MSQRLIAITVDGHILKTDAAAHSMERVQG